MGRPRDKDQLTWVNSTRTYHSNVWIRAPLVHCESQIIRNVCKSTRMESRKLWVQKTKLFPLAQIYSIFYLLISIYSILLYSILFYSFSSCFNIFHRMPIIVIKLNFNLKFNFNFNFKLTWVMIVPSHNPKWSAAAEK